MYTAAAETTQEYGGIGTLTELGQSAIDRLRRQPGSVYYMHVIMCATLGRTLRTIFSYTVYELLIMFDMCRS